MGLNTNIGPERVEVQDQPLGIIQVPGAGISTASFLISTNKSGAPVNVATAVQNMDRFEEIFGSADDINGDGYYAVQGYFDNAGIGSTAIIVNVGPNPTINDYIGSVSTHSGLRALDSIDEVGMIAIPGLPLEMAYLVHPALINYSKIVRADFGATLSTAFSLLAIPKEISKANEDKLVSIGQFVSSSGTGPYIVQVELKSAGIAEVTRIECVEDVGGSLNNKYFYINSANDETKYYVWFNIGGLGVDPNISGRTAIEIELSPGATASQVAIAVKDALDNLADFSASVATTIVTVTNSQKGPATDAFDAGNTTFTISTVTQGALGDLDLSYVKPGMLMMNSAGSFKGVISAVNDITNQVTVLTNPSNAFNAGDNIYFKIPSAVNYKEIVVNTPSRVAAWYFNNVIVTDRTSDAKPGDVVVVDPVGHVAGVIARIDANTAIGGHSHAPAGLRYADIAGIQGLSLSLSERVDAEPLRKNFINRITTFPGSGNIIFGGYTADSGKSPLYTADEQLIQVMRTLQYIKASLEPGLRSYIWENFSPLTQAQIRSSILDFLRRNIHLFPLGLPESSKFKVISVEPTQNELDEGLLKVRVQVRPNKAVRFIEITLEYPIPVT